MFTAYDSDASGFLEPSEVYNIFKVIATEMTDTDTDTDKF